MICKMLMTFKMPTIHRSSILLTVFVLIGLHGCQSAQTVLSTPNYNNTMVSSHPLPSQDIIIQEKHYKSRLPLGIGGNFDLFAADAASNVTDIYDSYVKPLRHGKIFRNHSYEIDYAILPKNGSAFNNTKKKDLFGTLSMKSNYKIQIGMSRKFRDFTDFLNPGFWLALGRFAPSPDYQDDDADPMMIMPLENNGKSIDIDPYDIYQIDLKTATLYGIE